MECESMSADPCDCHCCRDPDLMLENDAPIEESKEEKKEAEIHPNACDDDDLKEEVLSDLT